MNKSAPLITGTVISYLEMCHEENAHLQRGMNYRLHGKHSVILMSVRRDAPYADRFEEGGDVLIYEGHNVPNVRNSPINPKQVDQPMFSPVGSLTANGRFHEAAQDYKQGHRQAELVKVYEKVLSGVWVYNGFFRIVDAWQQWDGTRSVFKFKMEVSDQHDSDILLQTENLPHQRLIPTEVKLAVWKRDKGQCILCHSQDNLHFDHIIPFSKGGSSLLTENIQILCARHNLSKGDNIE